MSSVAAAIVISWFLIASELVTDQNFSCLAVWKKLLIIEL